LEVKLHLIGFCAERPNCIKKRLNKKVISLLLNIMMVSIFLRGGEETNFTGEIKQYGLERTNKVITNPGIRCSIVLQRY